MKIFFQHKYQLILIAAALLTGCATQPKLPDTAIEQENLSKYIIEYHNPSVNTEKSVAIGQSIIDNLLEANIPAISLKDPINSNLVYDNLEHAINIPAGLLTLRMENKNGKIYLLDYKVTALTNIQKNKTKHKYGGLFVPNSQESKIQAFWIDELQDKEGYSTPIESANYTNTMTSQTIYSTPQIKKELIYGGISNNTITLLYRELQLNNSRSNDYISGYTGYLARPAFSQEIKYDLSQGSTIGYREARFQVIKATNTDIRVKILTLLSDQ